jgi:hypothetical protein
MFIPSTQQSSPSLTFAHNLSLPQVILRYRAMRELHQFFSPTLTIDDTIRDVAWDYIREDYDIDVEDASAVIKHCLTQMKVI